MADISKEIEKLKHAVYGEEVRGSLVSLAEKNNEVSEATEAAEKKRVTAETGRVNAEKNRVSQETARKNAETARAGAESTRVDQENIRKSAETARGAAETGRANAEKARVAQEEARKTAETARASAESTRANQETARKNAETARASAEKKRVTAETGRVNAEQKRQIDTGAAIENCNTAIDRANKAADNANKAAESIQGKNGINDKSPSDATTYSGNKIEEMAQTNWIPEYAYDSLTATNATATYKDGKLLVDHTTPTESGSAYAVLGVDVKPNTTYTISWLSERTGATGGGIGIKGSDNKDITTAKRNDVNGSFSFSTGKFGSIKILFFGASHTSGGGGAGESATFYEVMLTEGEYKSDYIENSRDLVSELALLKENTPRLLGELYTEITRNSDLNNYTQKGVYRSIDSALTGTLSNKPENIQYGFKMTVSEITDNKHFIQEIEENVTRKIYRRVAKNSTLGEWVTLLDASDIADNLTTTVAGKVLSAKMGKQINDDLSAKYKTLNSALTTHSHAWGNITGKPSTFSPSAHTHDDRYFTESEINSKITSINNTIKAKIVSKSGNISFEDGGNNESYGYITIPSGCEMLAVYMQEVSGNVKLRCKGFNKNAGTGGYTVWLDFPINGNVFMHWIYAKL